MASSQASRPSNRTMASVISSRSSHTAPSADLTGHNQDLRLVFELLPVEILREIYSQCDIRTALALSQASHYFRSILKIHFTGIMEQILKRDFSPVDSFRTLLKMIETVPSGPTSAEQSYESLMSGVYIPFSVASSTRPAALLTKQALFIRTCIVVQDWESFFPSLRFTTTPELTRNLEQHEWKRFRTALYNWWRYALLFHSADKYLFFTTPTTLDVRMDFMRDLPTSQLVELRDLWETLREAVGATICPSLERVLAESQNTFNDDQARSIAWGHSWDNYLIVATIMRLQPSDLLHLFKHRHRYSTKASLVAAIRLRHPRIEMSRESLDLALEAALMARERAFNAFLDPHNVPVVNIFPMERHRGFPKSDGGVLDYEDHSWEDVRRKYSSDNGHQEPLVYSGPLSRFYYPGAYCPGLLVPPSS